MALFQIYYAKYNKIAITYYQLPCIFSVVPVSFIFFPPCSRRENECGSGSTALLRIQYFDFKFF